MTKVAADFGLEADFALDLTTYDEVDGEPWDFNEDWIQRKALDRIHRLKPGLVMLCPTCAPFSRLQGWNFLRMQNGGVEELLEDGMKHLCFAALICLIQHKAGRYFIFEHPDAAESWRTRVMSLVADLPGVVRTKFDFCMLGMTSEDEKGRAPVRKTTGILTNGATIAEVIGRARCDGQHRHIPLLHGKAKSCEVYPEKFCRRICEAYVMQLEEDQRQARTCRSSLSEAVAAVSVTNVVKPLVEAEEGKANRTREEARTYMKQLKQELVEEYGHEYVEYVCLSASKEKEGENKLRWSDTEN